MKKIQNILFVTLLSQFFVFSIYASTLKLQNVRTDGLGIFIAADFGAPLTWYALDPGIHQQIDSGLAKINKVIWYDVKSNLFWEVNIDQAGIILTVDPEGNAGTFKAGIGATHKYESIANPRLTGTPRAIQWNVMTYK